MTVNIVYRTYKNYHLVINASFTTKHFQFCSFSFIYAFAIVFVIVSCHMLKVMPFTVKQEKLSLDFCLKCYKGLVS